MNRLPTCDMDESSSRYRDNWPWDKKPVPKEFTHSEDEGPLGMTNAEEPWGDKDRESLAAYLGFDKEPLPQPARTYFVLDNLFNPEADIAKLWDSAFRRESK